MINNYPPPLPLFPVVILSGGMASRMRPMTEKIPKAMIEVNGRPFIYHQLRLLKSKGITNVMLCVGYLGEIIERYVQDGRKFSLQVEYFYDGAKLLGTGGAIKHIANKLPIHFFVLYGDSYLDVDYLNIETMYRKCGKKGIMTVFRNNGQWDTSNVLFRDGELVKYSKKNRNEEMRYIDYGISILNKTVFDTFPADIPFDLADVYEKLCDENQLQGCEVFERFYEIGSPRGLEDLKKKLTDMRY